MNDALSWSPGTGEAAEKVKLFDWSATPLGRIEDWPPELKTAAALVLQNHFPSALVWGPELVTIYNDGFRPMLGEKVEALGRSFADIWAEAWSEIGPLVERAFAGQSTFIENYPLVINRSGIPEQAYFTFSYSPVRAADGRVVGMIDTVIETTAAVAARKALSESEATARLLLAELQHRVRNSLSVVRSIARRTAENSDSVDEMLAHFQGRLDAFSRVQAKLTRRADSRVDLMSLIGDEIVAHAAREGEQVQIEGPDIALEQKTAERFSLAVHELATNAVKHGALGADHGRVSIAWEVQGKLNGGMLLFNWQESGVHLQEDPPAREGFGMELLRRSLPYDLGAETHVEFRPNGLRFELRMPLNGSA